MQYPNITEDQIQERCTKKVFARGEDYFYQEMIENPMFHGSTLSANCQGSEYEPYSVSVELTSTGIADAACSCPYDWGGDCKHIVALLLTYVHERDEIQSIEPVLTAIAEKPRATLLDIIAELLKREPALVPVVKTYTDGVTESQFGDTPPASAATIVTSATTTAYREQIDRLFGDGFLEQHQLHKVIAQLTELVRHAESLAQAGATEFALSILYALIHQSIVRYEDTLQNAELPRFVGTCTTQFVQIADTLQEPTALREYHRPLLELSFEAEAAFTPHLIHLLKQLCTTQDTTDLQTAIEPRLDESRDRQTHVQLLLYLHLNNEQIAAAFRLARREEAAPAFINLLLERQDEDTVWEALEEFSLTIEAYWDILKNPLASRIPNFTEQLLTLVEGHCLETAIMLYQGLIEQVLTSPKRTDYKTVQHYLTGAQKLYQHLDQESQWKTYLKVLRDRHRRKRTLLEMLESPLFTSRSMP
ncbi:MAG: SWIM zinc finger family protein [Candidatus Poribacteria bacterium]|nr:SWIM zinc finger family protein [Candidatus Poribacteria bacterium]